MECGLGVLEGSGMLEVQKHMKVHEGAGIELLSLGAGISAWIMSAKMECVLQNITWQTIIPFLIFLLPICKFAVHESTYMYVMSTTGSNLWDNNIDMKKKP